MSKYGYTETFENMLDNENIHAMLNTITKKYLIK